MRTLRPCLAASIVAWLSIGGIPIEAAAQGNTIVKGVYRDTGDRGYDETTTFTCRGTPTCTGTFTTTVRSEDCPNFVTFVGTFTVTGLNLAQSGPISGSLTFSGIPDVITLGDGTCGLTPPAGSETLSYTGTWDLARSTATVTAVGDDFSFPVTLTADVTAPEPVFPMTVDARIDSRTANASARIQFRPEDVGTNGSVFVFAYAPRGRVTGAAPASKADGDCSLAQLTPSGQLVALTASQLTAFLSGTLSAQGASVTILNNVSTPSVAGATFYVGYGPSGAAMLDKGVFRNAVTVPGSGVCPMLPAQTALWWNPRESGWGLNLNHQGNLLFGTLFTYDANRAPLWLVMSAGAMQSDGRTFTGDLYRTTGPAFNANPFTPIGPANVTKVGSMTVAFDEASSATLTYTVNGTQVVKSIQRQVYRTRASNCMPTSTSRAGSANYQDLWWNPAESGWGLNVTHQDNTLFATLFTYDASGRDVWLVMSAGERQSDGSYSGALYRTSGPVFNAAPFTPVAPQDVTAVGTMRLRFTDGEQGELTYTYEGATVTKTISRQVFSGPVSACN